ncbi:MAG: DUF6497 family protein [Paracoccaceae bacterium]|jgi:hypothetical protein|nr:DUF6497 family protein [Paracoccaceae bacterium]
MAGDGWHILREGDAVTVTRRLPLRWDVAAETALPGAGRLRVAQQVRQDLWRRLRRLRGFAPAVRVARADGGLAVRAGGRVDGPLDRQGVEARIAELLADPAARARWLRCARAGAVALACAVPLAGAPGALADTLPPPPEAPDLPSGQRVAPLDMVLERQGDGSRVLVLRYLAPRIAGGGRAAEDGLAYVDVVGDLDALCDGPGLAAAAAMGAAPDEIVVALVDRPLPRGATDPDATLFIGAYRPASGGCEWQ